MRGEGGIQGLLLWWERMSLTDAGRVRDLLTRLLPDMLAGDVLSHQVGVVFAGMFAVPTTERADAVLVESVHGRRAVANCQLVLFELQMVATTQSHRRDSARPTSECSPRPRSSRVEGGASSSFPARHPQALLSVGP